MSVTTRPRGPYAKTAERREEILAASTAVFAEAGFMAGSMRDVAERVGISVGGLLHHFPTKEALLEAVLDHRDAQDSERLRLEPLAGLDLVRGLIALADHNARHRPGLVRLYCVLSAEATASAHPAHGYFVRRYAWVVGVVAQAFDLARRRGQLACGVDPTSAARGVVALMDGLQVQWLMDPAVDMAAELRASIAPLLAVAL